MENKKVRIEENDEYTPIVITDKPMKAMKKRADTIRDTPSSVVVDETNCSEASMAVAASSTAVAATGFGHSLDFLWKIMDFLVVVVIMGEKDEEVVGSE